MHEGWRQSRRAALLTLGMGTLGLACRTRTIADDELSLDVIAERYVRLTLQLAQHQPSLVERWLGPSTWQPGPRRPVAELRAEITALQQVVDHAPSEGEFQPRATYLRRQIAALHLAARRLSGDSMTFAEEARAAFGDTAAQWLAHVRDSGPAREEARSELDRRLPGRGPLHERYAAFRKQHAVAPERVVPTLHRALEYCRARVQAHVSLPKTEQVQLNAQGVSGLEGRAVYQGELRSQVEIDTSGRLDLARAVWLVAHETYPGHHMQHVLCDQNLVEPHGWTERSLFPAFGLHLLMAEGAAESGTALLLDGSQFEAACHALAPTAGTAASAVEDLVAVHRAAAALDIVIVEVAQRFLDHDLNADSAAEMLRTEALVLDAQQFVSVIEHQRTRILAYPVGRRLVSRYVDVSDEDRWQRLAQVATTLVLPS